VESEEQIGVAYVIIREQKAQNFDILIVVLSRIVQCDNHTGSAEILGS
jgi:hypothetical protein